MQMIFVYSHAVSNRGSDAACSPPLTLVAVTISTLLAGSVQAAAPESQGYGHRRRDPDRARPDLSQHRDQDRLDPIETPQAISVVDGRPLSLRGVSSVSEALRYVPGVNTELRGGAVNRLDLFNIRGFDNYQNFYDGLLLQYNDWNLQPQIDPVAIEQLEVFKGPTSVLYGSMPRRHGQPHRQAPQRESKHNVSVATGTGTLKDDPRQHRCHQRAGRLSAGGAGPGEGWPGGDPKEERYVFAPSLDWQLGERTC